MCNAEYVFDVLAGVVVPVIVDSDLCRVLKVQGPVPRFYRTMLCVTRWRNDGGGYTAEYHCWCG